MGKTHLKFLFLLTLVVAIIAVVVYQKQQKETGEAFQPRKLFESLQVQDIARVEIVAAENEVTLTKQSEETWGLATRNDYPIDAERLRRLVFDIGGMQAVDRLTANPEKYDRLGVGEQPETARVRLLDKDDNELAGLYFGKQRESQTDTPGGFAPPRGQYVRIENDPAVYLLGAVSYIDSDPTQWLQREVIKVEQENLQRVRVENRGTTDSFTLVRTGSDPFTISGEVPDGLRGKASDISSVAGALGQVSLQDVLNADDPGVQDIDFSTTYSAIQKNGLVYTVAAGERDEDRFIRIAARYEKSMDLSLSDERTSDTVQAKALEPAEATMKQINERHSGWVYQIASYVHDKFTKKFSDVLEAVPEPTPKPSPSPTPYPPPAGQIDKPPEASLPGETVKSNSKTPSTPATQAAP